MTATATLFPPDSSATCSLPVGPPASPRRSLFRRVLQDRTALLGEIALGRQVDMRGVVGLSLLLTALGGLALGASAGPLQALSAAVKLPLINLAALAICLPALYVFAMLAGSQASLGQLLRITSTGLGLRAAILAGLTPLLLFFSSVGSTYGFLLLLGLGVFALAEGAFLRTIEQGFEGLRSGTGDKIPRVLTHTWSLVYLAVVAQLAWTMRPLIKHPDAPFLLWGGYPQVDGGANMFTYFARQLFG